MKESEVDLDNHKLADSKSLWASGLQSNLEEETKRCKQFEFQVESLKEEKNSCLNQMRTILRSIKIRTRLFSTCFGTTIETLTSRIFLQQCLLRKKLNVSNASRKKKLILAKICLLKTIKNRFLLFFHFIIYSLLPASNIILLENICFKVNI